MKKILNLFLLSMAVSQFCTTAVNAQERKIDFYEAGPRAHSFYVEMGGPGFISANYDVRFQQTRNSWGARAGVGYIKIDDESLYTVPVQINYLLGKNGNYFEIGGGTSLVHSSTALFDWNSNMHSLDGQKYKSKKTELMGTLLFGYRKQPLNGGFNFRVGLTPIIYRQQFIPYLLHLSFGYSF